MGEGANMGESEIIRGRQNTPPLLLLRNFDIDNLSSF